MVWAWHGSPGRPPPDSWGERSLPIGSAGRQTEGKNLFAIAPLPPCGMRFAWDFKGRERGRGVPEGQAGGGNEQPGNSSLPRDFRQARFPAMTTTTQRIPSNLRQCGGSPHIRSTRIRVTDKLERLAAGLSFASCSLDLLPCGLSLPRTPNGCTPTPATPSAWNSNCRPPDRLSVSRKNGCGDPWPPR